MIANPATIVFRATAACVLAALAGCGALRRAEPARVNALLRPTQSSSDAVTLEIYWATLPPDTEADSKALWRFLQEERLDAALRRELLQNGLRAGIVGGAPPTEVVRLLDPLEKRNQPAESADDDALAALARPTGVQGKVTQTRPGQPVRIKASEVLDEAVVLEPGGVGQTYRQVQAIYHLEVQKGAGGAYSVEVTPELHYGEARWKWTADDTGLIARQAPLRDRRVFPNLRIQAPLVVGEMLLVTSPPDSESRLGSYFHRATDGAPGERKAILVRLATAPTPSPFGPDRDGEAGAR